MLQANLYLCYFPWASLFCSGYDAYRILFTLRVFIWIDLISSLFVVVSWFAVFVRFFMVSVVETWWKNSGTGVFLCLDSCVCIAFVSLEEFICVRSCDWREIPNFDIWLRKIICTSHKFTAKNAKIPTRWSTVSWQWDSIKTHGPSPTSNYDCRCCTTRNCCQPIPVDKEEVWVAVAVAMCNFKGRAWPVGEVSPVAGIHCLCRFAKREKIGPNWHKHIFGSVTIWDVVCTCLPLPCFHATFQQPNHVVMSSLCQYGLLISSE